MKYSVTFLPLLALVALLAPQVIAGGDGQSGGDVQKPGYPDNKDGGYYNGDKDKDKHYDHKDYDPKGDDHKDYDHKDYDHKDYDHKDYDHKDYDHKDYDHKDYDHKDYEHKEAYDSGYGGEHDYEKYKTQVLWGQCMLRLLCSMIDDH